MFKYRSISAGIGWLLVALAFSSCTTVSSGPQVSIREFPVISDSEPVAEAIKAVDASPQSAPAYVQLASAYIKTARRTGNFYLNADARRAIERALQISPNDPSARVLKASLHLTFHEFAEALKLGEELYAENPDAVSMGVITDAHTQLGNYPQAVEWAQKMVDAKPNSSSYARAALLRAMHGETEGAVELYKLSARTADPADKEAQSWSLSQLGDLYWRNGRYDEAERVYDESLSLTPNYNLAMLGKGRTRAAKGDLDSAASLVSGALERSTHTSYAIMLGDIKRKQGNEAAAQKLYALADNAELLGDLHDAHRIALMLADHDTDLDKALEIAETDYAGIKDIYAADILAWCLYKKGRFAEAREKSREALRINTKDAVLLYHAGMIEKALGNSVEASRLLQAALDLNPAFDLVQAPVAKAALRGLPQ
ncbi:MAG: tetratricopeptide repeat protein [bacterium]|nr:tetratricopeptide repeat protein [bacterium]